MLNEVNITKPLKLPKQVLLLGIFVGLVLGFGTDLVLVAVGA